MTAGLNQTVRELQQLLQAVSQQLAKRQEGVRPVTALFLPSNKTLQDHSPVFSLATVCLNVEYEHSTFVISCRRLTKICPWFS